MKNFSWQRSNPHIVKNTNKYILPWRFREKKNSEINNLCYPSSQSSILRYNFGAQESLPDLTSYSLTKGQFFHSLTYKHFKKTITLNVCRYVCTHVLVSFILICLARLYISKGRVDYPSLIHQCEHSTAHQVSTQYVFDEWMNKWHTYKMETQSLSLFRRLTHLLLLWFSVVSPSYWSYLLWTLKMPKSLLNNPQGLKYCCTYWGHKMHVCWMKRLHQELHHPERGRTANKTSYFHLYPSSLQRERERERWWHWEQKMVWPHHW